MTTSTISEPSVTPTRPTRRWWIPHRTDVDLYGEWATMRGVPATPRVGRHVEYTRAGRRIVRRNDGAALLPRDPAEDYIVAALDRFRATARSVGRCGGSASAPETSWCWTTTAAGTAATRTPASGRSGS